MKRVKKAVLTVICTAENVPNRKDFLICSWHGDTVVELGWEKTSLSFSMRKASKFFYFSSFLNNSISHVHSCLFAKQFFLYYLLIKGL